MKIKFLTFLAGVAVLLVLPACSTIKNLFPDKEKDYQYTTEIPALTIPKDLETSEAAVGADVASPSPSEEKSAASEEAKPAASPTDTLPEGVVVAPRQGFHGHAADETKATADKAANAEPPSTAATEAPAATEGASSPVADRPEPATDTAESAPVDLKKASVELTKFTSNSNHFLRLGLPLRKAWLVVGKALTHNSVEVTLRNQDEGLYTVQFDSDEKVIEDESFTDEIKFLFGGFQGHEKEFALKLIENKNKTDVVVVDKEQQQPLPDTVGLKLLVLLEETIKKDLAK